MAGPAAEESSLRRLVGVVWDSLSIQAGLVVFLFFAAWIASPFVGPRTVELGADEAQELLPQPTIESTQSGYRLTYPVRYQSADDVFNRCPRKSLPSSRWSSGGPTFSEEVVFEAAGQEVLHHLRDQLESVDVFVPEMTVIRGRVTDAHGRPVADVHVDLLDADTNVNVMFAVMFPKKASLAIHLRKIDLFKTRRDGTFVLVNPFPPAKASYYLRFRPGGGPRGFASASFPVRRSSVVSIAVSRNLVETYYMHWLPGGLMFVLLVARAAPRSVRYLVRKYRRRPGTCLACGYDLRGAASEVCSECGTSISGEVKEEVAEILRG